MSIEAVAWALKQNVTETLPNGKIAAKHTAKLVLIALANHHNESTGECYPAKWRLMEASCSSEKTVERCLRWLEAEGWIKRIPGYTEKGRRTSNSYLINFSKNSGGQVDPLPQPVRGSRRRRPVPDKLTESTSLNRKNEPCAPTGADRNISPEEAPPAAAPCPPPASAPAAAIDWRNRLIQYRRRAIWPPKWGPPMRAPGCLVPPDLVREWDATQGKAFVEEEQKPAWQGRKKRDWQHASSAIN